jgi:sugar O-acyltransferase (sialic acid O-acetyltransferase NeuD family)
MARRKQIIVWGAGGHGKVIIDALLASESCEVVGVVDDNPRKTGTVVLGVPVVDFSGGLPGLRAAVDFDAMAIAIGDNYTRSSKFHDVRQLGIGLINVIHPAAYVSRFAELGQGVAILAGAVVNPGTVVEDNVCVNTSASVDHDNYLGRSCHVFPNATLAGGVRVEEYAYVGSGAVIKPNLTVHRYSYIGAGALVLEDVPQGVMVAGVPAGQIGKQTKRPDRERLTQCLSQL